MIKLGSVADVKISGVDKKSNPGERTIRLCNYTDVYYNWAITKEMYDALMVASAKSAEIDEFTIGKGMVAITKDSETREDIGHPVYVADDFEDVLLGYHCALIKPHKGELDGRFLNAALHTSYAARYFANNSAGSGQRYYLNEDAIKRLSIYLPLFKQQKIIGQLWSNIDRKICLNRKKIEKLEALAKTIYDYWFVQFDFPDANGRPYKSSGGKMVYNPILKREMPEEWEVLPFAQCIDFTMGQSPSGETLNETNKGTLFYQGATDFGDYFPTPRQYTTLPVRKAMPGDVLLSVRAPVGTVNIADDECCIGRGVGAFRRRGNAKRGLLVWFHLKSLAPYFDRKNNAGTTFGAIGKEDFLLLSVPKPSDSLIERYENMTFNMSRQMLTLHKEIRNLTNLRDFLLPLLMNGQVEVGE